MKDFIKHPVLPWLLVVLLISLLIIKSLKPTPLVIPPPPDHRIDSLSHVVDSLNNSYNKLKHSYDSAQANVRTEIQYIQIQNAQDITNIRNFTLHQRDSMWSTLNP